MTTQHMRCRAKARQAIERKGPGAAYHYVRSRHLWLAVQVGWTLRFLFFPLPSWPFSLFPFLAFLFLPSCPYMVMFSIISSTLDPSSQVSHWFIPGLCP